MWSSASILTFVAQHRLRWLLIALGVLTFTMAGNVSNAEAGCGDYLTFRGPGYAGNRHAVDRTATWRAGHGAFATTQLSYHPTRLHGVPPALPSDSSCPGCQSRGERGPQTPPTHAPRVERSGVQGVLARSVSVAPPSVSSVMAVARVIPAGASPAELWRPPRLHDAF